jgi:hypothetical protein
MAATIGFGRREWFPSFPDPSPTQASAALISFLQVIPDRRMRRRERFPQWFLLLVAVSGIGSALRVV